MKKIILIIVMALVIMGIAKLIVNTGSDKDFLKNMSPKEYYIFSQKAYKYNHRNDQRRKRK